MSFAFMPANVRAVFTAFTEETRIPIRIPSEYQSRQAVQFAEHFELWELVVTAKWLRARIVATESGQERNSYSRQSLQWHCFFGDAGDLSLERFQSKLGLALEWAKRHAPSLLPQAEPCAEDAAQKPAAKAVSEEEWQSARNRMAAMVAELEGRI